MNPQLQGKDKILVDTDLSPSNFLLNHLSAQQRVAQQVGLQQRDPLFLIREQRRNDNILAAAVQQQLVASLTSPTIQLYGSLGSQPHMHPDLSGGLLSRAQQHQHNNPSLVQRLSGQSTSSHNYFNMGMAPKLLDSLVREATSGTKRTTTAQQIPCLARGMATDHNSMTAYFEISSDVTHGQHLYCSHSICRAAGVKFRYCLYCKKPVTKQNFRSRHLHADVVSATTESGKKRKHQQVADADSMGSDQGTNERGEGNHEDEDGSHPKDVVLVEQVRGQDDDSMGASPNKNLVNGKASSETERGPPPSHFSTAIVSRAVEIMQYNERRELQGKDSEAQEVLHVSNSENDRLIDPGTCHHPGSTKVGINQEKTGSYTQPHDETRDKMTGTKRSLVESDDRTNTACELQTLHRRRIWLELFFKRPQCLGVGIGIDTWISQVLAVSDPARSWNIESDKASVTDLEGNASSDERGLTRAQEPSSSQLAKWLGLLEIRPEACVQGSKATAWLIRVLEVSCQDYGDDDATRNKAER